MAKKPKPLLGMHIEKFNSLIRNKNEIILQPAKLIPFYKPGDEMALTSIFLSGLRLVEEFKKSIFQAINLTRSGNIHVYSEIEFLSFDNKRIDGLLIVERGKKIVDAILIEVKNKNVELNEKQITDYLNIAKEYKIPKLLTISNQFVSFPTQSPMNVKPPKNVTLYHLSWSYILTMAHILLFENDNNIEDRDQVEIMKEIVEYFETDKSGIIGFKQMKPGWIEVVRKTNSGIPIHMQDKDVDETVSSWLEEERDMALMLSRNLGLLVKSGHKKYKDNLSNRIEFEKRELINKNNFESILQIEGAASDISVRPYFNRRNVEMSVTLSPPLDRKYKAQLTWLKNQIRSCERKNPELFANLKNNILIEIDVKYLTDPIKCNLDEFDYVHEQLFNREIKNYSIILAKNLGRKFESRKMFVMIIEDMLIDFYKGILQHIKKWEKPVPQIQNEIDKSN